MFTIITNLRGCITILLTSRISHIVMKEILSNDNHSVMFVDSLLNIPIDNDIVKDFRDTDCCWYYSNDELAIMVD